VDPRFVRDILSWRQISTPFGVLLTPLGTKEIDVIAGINPQYKFLDKWIGTGNFSISPDPYAIVIGNAIEALRANSAPSTGVDFDSKYPSRRAAALNSMYFRFLEKEVAKMAGNSSSEPEKISVKLSDFVKELADKIYRLDYSKEESLFLAQKVEKKEFIPKEIKSGTEVLGVFKGNLYGGKQVLVWSENAGYIFQGEDYGNGLWRFMNKGLEVLLRAANSSNVTIDSGNIALKGKK